MNSDVKEIESIIFGVLSTKEIIDMSVCEVNNTRLLGPGSVYDERMGCNTEMNIQCVTCGMLPRLCPGHFAFIKLNEYIIKWSDIGNRFEKAIYTSNSYEEKI